MIVAFVLEDAGAGGDHRLFPFGDLIFAGFGGKEATYYVGSRWKVPSDFFMIYSS